MINLELEIGLNSLHVSKVYRLDWSWRLDSTKTKTLQSTNFSAQGHSTLYGSFQRQRHQGGFCFESNENGYGRKINEGLCLDT